MTENVSFKGTQEGLVEAFKARKLVAEQRGWDKVSATEWESFLGKVQEGRNLNEGYSNVGCVDDWAINGRVQDSAILVPKTLPKTKVAMPLEQYVPMVADLLVYELSKNEGEVYAFSDVDMIRDDFNDFLKEEAKLYSEEESLKVLEPNIMAKKISQKVFTMSDYRNLASDKLKGLFEDMMKNC